MEGSKPNYVDNTSQLFSAGLTIRQKEPKNLESPFDRIDSYLTPTELFYIRSPFPAPTLELASYETSKNRRLRGLCVEGDFRGGVPAQ